MWSNIIDYLDVHVLDSGSSRNDDGPKRRLK